MMNELLRDLINMRKVVVFIDNMIVGMETKESHDELVVEVIKRLEENDLYVKLEKCKWKVREVEFLGVVIRPEGIKNGEGESKRSFGVANAEIYQGHAEIFRTGKLLLPVYRRICNGGKAIT